MKAIRRNILLTPGPATTSDSVKAAMMVPDICPREESFRQLIDRLRKDLVRIVRGDVDYTAILFAGSGTAVMDACINSVVPPGKKVAVINNGAYGQRMISIAQAYGIPFVDLAFPIDESPDPKKLEAALAHDHAIACVAIVHHETTTGLLNPIKEIGRVAKNHDCVFIVDGISSFAGIPIDVREYCIDFLLATSNKCLQGMPGVSFVIGKRQKIENTEAYPPRSYYLNLYQQYSYLQRHRELPFTAPVQVLYAMRQAVKEYFDEGEQDRYARYLSNWETLVRGLKDLGFKLMLDRGPHSHLLSTVFEPLHPNFDFDLMHDLLLERGFTIYPGKVGKKETFRLGNLGAIYRRDIEDFLVTLKETLREMNVHLK